MTLGRRRSAALALLAVLVLGGCATGPSGEVSPEATTTGGGEVDGGGFRYDARLGVCPPPPEPGEMLPDITAPAAADTLQRVIAIDDPLEPVNRGVYAFNYLFDRYVFLPAVEAYTFVVPEVLRDRVHDFFSNLGELVNFANLLLQGRPGPAAETAFRFGVNSTLGLLGFIDLASAAGMPSYNEDFGQTLGCWGVAAGPYLMLPLLGPSSVRDAGGLAADYAAFSLIDPFGAASYNDADWPVALGINTVRAVDTRANIPFRYFGSGSPFEYEYIRLLYTRMRRADLSR